MDVMLDIETLDIRPSAVVLSIGAIAFTQEESGAVFYTALSIDQQLRRGRTIDASTLMWWMGQGTEAQRCAFADSRANVVPALLELDRFFQDIKPSAVWANSPSFDLVIAEDLYRTFYPRAGQARCPWSYRDARDLRTLRELAGVDRKWEPESLSPGIDHHPVADCRWQIEVVREARRRLGITT